MANPRITILGSCMVDIVASVNTWPMEGQTVLANHFDIFTGGKGFNQAVAAARLGADTTMITALGDDEFRKLFQIAFEKEKINKDFVYFKEHCNTGMGLIILDQEKNNRIIAAPQANMQLTQNDVGLAEDHIACSDVLSMHLEVPIDTIQRAAEIANKHQTITILNPAPAIPLPQHIFSLIDVIVVNETECLFYTGYELTNKEDVISAGQNLLALGFTLVVITLGKRGVFYMTHDEKAFVPAYTVEVVDTTGAGDSFCGALTVAMAERKIIVDAVRFANAAAACAVTKLGAMPSIPFQSDIDSLLK